VPLQRSYSEALKPTSKYYNL